MSAGAREEQVEYFVLNEHTLCHREPGWRLAGVLAISPLRGGHDLGPLPIMATDKVRPATLDDFAAFRVSPAGHIAPFIPRAKRSRRALDLRASGRLGGGR